jgi:hypothetical protein
MLSEVLALLAGAVALGVSANARPIAAQVIKTAVNSLFIIYPYEGTRLQLQLVYTSNLRYPTKKWRVRRGG